MRLNVCTAVMLFAVSSTALGQSAVDEIAAGDRAYAALEEPAALEHYQKAVAAEPKNYEAVWNAEIMRLNSFVRLIAKSILGGKVFGEANWNNAVRYMEAAVAAEPQRVVHRLDLGEVYRDIGLKDKAREQWNIGLKLPSTDYNDPRFKGDIQADLDRLGSS